MSQDTSSSEEEEEEEGPCIPCKICGCTDSNDWECGANGSDCFEDKDDSYYLLKTWIKPLIQEPFRHCHEDSTFHAYGKLDTDHDLFPLFWEEFTQDKEDDNQPKKCPQCKCKDIRISSEVFYRGYFELQSFKCYVCPRGCITCYVMIPISGMAGSMMQVGDSFFKALDAISRIDLSEEDTALTKKRRAKHEKEEKGKKKAK